MKRLVFFSKRRFHHCGTLKRNFIGVIVGGEIAFGKISCEIFGDFERTALVCGQKLFLKAVFELRDDHELTVRRHFCRNDFAVAVIVVMHRRADTPLGKSVLVE